MLGDHSQPESVPKIVHRRVWRPSRVSVLVSLVRDEDKAAVTENSEHFIYLYPVFKRGKARQDKL